MSELIYEAAAKLEASSAQIVLPENVIQEVGFYYPTMDTVNAGILHIQAELTANVESGRFGTDYLGEVSRVTWWDGDLAVAAAFDPSTGVQIGYAQADIHGSVRTQYHHPNLGITQDIEIPRYLPAVAIAEQYSGFGLGYLLHAHLETFIATTQEFPAVQFINGVDPDTTNPEAAYRILQRLGYQHEVEDAYTRVAQKGNDKAPQILNMQDLYLVNMGQRQRSPLNLSSAGVSRGKKGLLYSSEVEQSIGYFVKGKLSFKDTADPEVIHAQMNTWRAARASGLSLDANLPRLFLYQ